MQRNKLPYIFYSLLALFILLPLLKPGYVFALDMVFGPKIQLPAEVTSSYPFYLFLRILNFVIPSQILEKAILFAIIVLCGVGAYKLTEFTHNYSKNNVKKSTLYSLPTTPYFFAGLLYAVNPFTYERFMDGQFSVLLGYALLPFFTKALFEMFFQKKAGNQTLFKIVLLALLISFVSIHAIGYMVVISLTTLLIAAIKYWKDKELLKILLLKSLAVLAIVLIASSYWLVPALFGNMQRSAQIKSFDDRQLLSFRTDGSTDIGVIGNSAALYGYWGEREGRFIVPKNEITFWFIIAFTIISLAGYGFIKERNKPEVQVLVISAVIGLILAIGIAAEPFAHINRFLIDHIPYFRGYREPQKFISLPALAYAVLGGLGAYHLINNLSKYIKQSTLYPLSLALLLIPLIYTPTFVWGFADQLHAKNYPADWAQINQTYAKKAHGKILFLPWHQYMYFDFAGRVIANPGPRFFDGKIIAGDNSEIGLIPAKASTKDSAVVNNLLNQKDKSNFAKKLSDADVEYIFLSKTVDYKNYSFLDKMQGIKLIKNSKTLLVYKVQKS